MSSLVKVTEDFCELCGEVGPTIEGYCAACYEGDLTPWMADLLFEEASWVNSNAWAEYLDYAMSRRGSEDGVTALTLAGSLDEHRWVRLILEACQP